MSSFRTSVDRIPEDAVQCTGPMLYSLDHWVCPNGDFYKIGTTGRITKMTPCAAGKQYYAFAQAKYITDEGNIEDMIPIEGIYIRNKGACRVLIRVLVCYYFVDKIDNMENMRASLINNEAPLSPDNLHWITSQEQKNKAMTIQRSRVDPTNIYREVQAPEDIDTEYIEWNNYFIKKDGLRVIKLLSNDNFREITIRTSNDGYRNVIIIVDGKSKSIRVNRLLKLATEGISGGDVVDHVDGNITNNSIDNLETVSHVENVRRGQNSIRIIKVDAETKEIIEYIRCIKEYTDSLNADYDHRALSQRLDTFSPYNGFLWFNESTQDIIYTITDNRISMMDQANSIHIIREKIEDMLITNKLTERMVPSNNHILSNTIDIFDSLDPRGNGKKDMMDDTNDKIKSNYPCSRLLSYFGKGDNGQIILCMQTLLTYTRSRDNLLLPDRKCPLCVNCHSETACRMKFNPDGAEASIPIYSFTSSRKTKTNQDP